MLTLHKMFTPEWREQTRTNLLKIAESDSRISGGAITGSASVNQLDEWSDIDLAFGIKNTSHLPAVIESYTKVMYEEYRAVHHFDVPSGSWVYRVFLLSDTLQVDLAFVPEEQFGARASNFQLVFGKTGTIPYDQATSFPTYVGWCWLHALHVRSSLKRNRPWQVEFFISGMRDHLISIYCRRYCLPEKQGRGVDNLPSEQLKKLETTLVKSMERTELKRAFAAITELCLEEIQLVDEKLFSEINVTFLALAKID